MSPTLSEAEVQYALRTVPVVADWGYPDVRRYAVVVADQVVGHVESWRSSSWRTNKSGTVRTSKIGNPKHWSAQDARGRDLGRYFYRRSAAVGAVLGAVLTSTPPRSQQDCWGV